MARKWLTTERCVSITATIFLGIAFTVSLLLNGDPECIIPYTQIVIPVVHGLCVTMAFISIFKPNFVLEFLVLQIEAAVTILTNETFLGIFLYYGSLFLFICYKGGIKTLLVHLMIYQTIHFFTLFLTYTHGWYYTLLYFGCSLFYLTFYFWIYEILKAKFSCFAPTKVKENSNIKNRLPGTEVDLKNYNLTERQRNLIIDNLKYELSYKELSEKYNISVSTVKKDFTSIYSVFGVTKLEELHLLLLQYQIEE